MKLKSILRCGDIVGIGTSNKTINIVAARILKIDERNKYIYFGDVKFTKTLINIMANNNVTIYRDKFYYQLKGTGKYFDDKKSKELANKLFKKIYISFNCKGLLIIKINKIIKL